MFRFKCFVLVVPILLVAMIGCQSVDMVPKTLSAAGSVQDVIDAWDLHCADFSFYSCPPDAGDALACTKTMGDMYFGADFDRDCGLLIDAIHFELLSGILDDPDVDDFLSAVLSDPAWFD